MIKHYKSVQTSYLEIAYEERGDPHAPPIILVHGFPDDVRTWDGVVDALVNAGYRTLAPYLRGFGMTRFLDKNMQRSGQLAALGHDIIEFVDSMNIDRFILVGHDWGARAGYVIASLIPERVSALVVLSVGYGTNNPQQHISFAQAQAYWYQWYFHIERGRATLEQDRRGFCRYLWKIWSPTWRFDDKAFETTAQSFDNPDFVEIVIHSYRHRWGNAPGDPHYNDIEKHLANVSSIAVPTTMLHGADDGATLPESSAGKERHFTHTYTRHILPGVGHFVQREKPDAAINAILERARK